jgi:hypothetical protein
MTETAIEDEATEQALKDNAAPGCQRCLLDELFGEDWD